MTGEIRKKSRAAQEVESQRNARGKHVELELNAASHSGRRPIIGPRQLHHSSLSNIRSSSQLPRATVSSFGVLASLFYFLIWPPSSPWRPLPHEWQLGTALVVPMLTWASPLFRGPFVRYTMLNGNVSLPTNPDAQSDRKRLRSFPL